jgi:hypothetical protein
MAKWGSADFQELKKLQQNIEKLSKVDMDRFYEACIKELAARLLGFVIPATPIGVYPAESGKKGGTLKRGWGAKSYADSLPVTKIGHTYQIEIINPVEYASYVEYGHRTRGGKGWVPGRYFLTISEEKLKEERPAILERKLKKMFKEVFNA